MRIRDEFNSLAEICYKPLGEKGEDALAYDLTKPDIHAQAVFDGCGGAGAWQYPEFKGATGAFVAAQSVSELFLEWFDALDAASVKEPRKLAESFHDAADACLKKLKSRCAPMGVAGSLVKSFPCTASIACVTGGEDGSILLTALNAGDSRVYFMTRNSGLVQMTHDDSRGDPDPLQSLRDSAALSNLLNADKPFKVAARQVKLKLPCIIVNATDGVFGFLRSPMDFEYLLLKTLMEQDTVSSFEKAFESEIRKVTGDDSTCLISFYGWDSYGDIKRGLRDRCLRLKHIVAQMDAFRDDREAMEQEILRQWNEYKKTTLWDEMQE